MLGFSLLAFAAVKCAPGWAPELSPERGVRCRNQDGSGTWRCPEALTWLTSITRCEQGLAREARTGAVDVYIRTYWRDIRLGILQSTLRSLRAYGAEFVGEIVLGIAAEDFAEFAEMLEGLPELDGWVRVVSTTTMADGLPMFYDYIKADLATAGSAPNVMFMDGDMLLCEGVTLADLVDPSGRPYLVTRPFSSLPPHVERANAPSMRLVADKATDYTLLGRLLYPRAAFKAMRQRLLERYPPNGDASQDEGVAGAVRRMIVENDIAPHGKRHMDNYSPFGALLLDALPEAVHILRIPPPAVRDQCPVWLLHVYKQLDGKHHNSSSAGWLRLQRAVASGEPICSNNRGRRHLSTLTACSRPKPGHSALDGRLKLAAFNGHAEVDAAATSPSAWQAPSGELVARSTGIVARSTGTSSATANLCMDGRLAPQLFLLGAQKSATTLFASTLYRIPGMMHFAAKDKGHQKEPHVFDGSIQRFGRSWWLSGYPNCSAEQKRAVSFDATPILYLKRAPSAIAKQYTPQLCPLSSCSQRLHFIVLLREPLGRLQSAFYNWIRAGWNKAWSRTSGRTIQDYAEEVLQTGRDPCGGNVWGPFSGSLYAPQLRWWLEEQAFEPSQFMLVPYGTLVAPGGVEAITRTVLHKLGLSMPAQLGTGCMMGKTNSSRCNAGSSGAAAIESELRPETLAALRALLERTTGAVKVAQVLVTQGRAATRTGVSLFGYTGASEPGPVAGWLRSSW